MPEQNGQHIIRSLRQRWQRSYLLGALLLTAAGAILFITLLQLFTPLSWWWIIPVFLISSCFIYWLRPFRLITDEDITSFLNHSYPELEESAHLLLLPHTSLNLLQQLQQQKTEKKLSNIQPPAAMHRPLRKGSLILITTVCICALAIAGTAALQNDKVKSIKSTGSSTGTGKKEQLPAGIKTFSVTIDPPAYTKQSRRSQEQFSLRAEEGSNIRWSIRTSGNVDSLNIIFNNKETIPLTRSGDVDNEWILERVIRESGFYQLQLPGTNSELYTLDVIHDQPAAIRILSPQQYTTIEPGRKAVTNLRVHISDDYGVNYAQIITTRASGKGESVSFKEQQFGFPVPFSGQKEIESSKLLDLAAMGLQGGDELYFYVKVIDNHGQESRSDMYFVSLPDTSELLSMSGMESGVNQFPEYFRSQRQIIIDTEKLLKEQSSVSKDTFNARSNDLGIEQKLLRLRYGKFLGEENESGGGHSPDDGHDHGSEPAYGDIQSLIDQYAHKHDNAEDATFFEPEQKAQLKAILTEMWNSELKLRTYIPSDALPYQYKALRLLKELQQKSRAYVSKTSIRMPPLKPEKRLTGNLEKIDPAGRLSKETKEDIQLIKLREAMSTLEMLKQKKQPAISGQENLVAAEKAISAKAMAQPSVYLPALSAVRSIIAAPASAKKQDIMLVQRALQSIIQTTVELPQKKNVLRGKLGALYFKKLEQ